VLIRSQPAFRGTIMPATAYAVQVRCASLKKTKQRIHASKNIEKITKAMKNVASARMKAAEAEAKSSTNFVIGVNTYLDAIPKESFSEPEGKHIIVPITSDRGLCGAVNSNVIRMIQAQLKAGEVPKKDFSFSVVGAKGKDQIMRLQPLQLANVYDEIQKKPISFAQACALADEILQQEFDTLSIYYTKFINTGTQEPSRMDLFSPAKVSELADSLDEYETEPDKLEIMEALNTFYFASNLYYCISTSIASEQASRMIAMDGASRNAKDMIQKLTILFNRTRQAIITGQLIEITSAAESIK